MNTRLLAVALMAMSASACEQANRLEETLTGKSALVAEERGVAELSIFETLRSHGCIVEPCGSRATCNPPPMNTDDDYLVELPWSFWGYGHIHNLLDEAGFRKDGKEYGGRKGQFESWRRNEVNLILTADQKFAAKHRAATHVCKSLNLLDKGDRVRVFQAVLYGNRA